MFSFFYWGSVAAASSGPATVPQQQAQQQQAPQNPRPDYMPAGISHSRLTAEVRANALLMTLLRPEQRAQYERREWITETSPGGRRYIISPSGSLAVDGSKGHSICVHQCDSNAPVSDYVIALLLSVRANEFEMRWIGNPSVDLRGPLTWR